MYTRREFLRQTGMWVVSTRPEFRTVDRIFGPWESKELESDSNLLIIDFAPTVRINGLEQSTFPDNETMIRTLAGKHYLPPQTFGVNSYTNGGVSPEAVSLKDPVLGAAVYFTQMYTDHGQEVAKEALKTGCGLKSVRIHPLQDCVEPAQERTDKLGNKVYISRINVDKVSKIIQNSPGVKVVNCSWQAGPLEATLVKNYKKIPMPSGKCQFLIYKDPKNGNISYYAVTGTFGAFMDRDGIVKVRDQSGIILPPTSNEETASEITEKMMEDMAAMGSLSVASMQTREAYDPDLVSVSMAEVRRLCNAHPKVLFVMAAGNVSDDLRGVDKPSNSLFVAEWNVGISRGESNVLGARVLGADIYVNNKSLGKGRGSSFSAPTVAVYADKLIRDGWSVADTKKILLDCCTTQTFNAVSRGGTFIVHGYNARVFGQAAAGLKAKC